MSIVFLVLGLMASAPAAVDGEWGSVAVVLAVALPLAAFARWAERRADL